MARLWGESANATRCIAAQVALADAVCDGIMHTNRNRGSRRYPEGAAVVYMVVEHFRAGPEPVYHRLRDRGRLAPEGLRYVGSWVTTDLQRCYQVMECDDERLLMEWIGRWKDVVDFEVVPVLTSAEAAAAVGPSS